MKYIFILALLLGLGIGLFWWNDEAPMTESNSVAAKDENVVQEASRGGATAEVVEGEEAAVSDDMVGHEEKVFTLDSFRYGYSESELHVTVGDTVTINLTSSDGFHDWVVDEFNAATDRIQAGGATSVTFVADKPGAFEYYCSVGNHRAQGMVGTLVVEEGE